MMFLFKLETTTRTYLLQAQSQIERQSWVKAIYDEVGWHPSVGVPIMFPRRADKVLFATQ